MKVRRIAVALPASLAAEIDRLVGKRNRSAFAMEIIERELCKLKLRAIGEAADGDQELV
jgi:metal-responsive CopG/Arc/MetJ family transcriptional regulator